jgi:hypothetical protein
MARNRLADVVSPPLPMTGDYILTDRTVITGMYQIVQAQSQSKLTNSDASAPQQASYPPPSNGVIPPSRGTNPYAEQAVSAAPGGNYNQYGAQQQNQNYGGNQYAQGGQGGNPYAQQQQYGQQEQYAMGGVGNGQSGGGDFWSELTNTNQNLTLLQEQIQAVRSAHQKSLVSPYCLLIRP